MRSKLKILTCVLAVVLCMTAFPLTAAASDGGHYDPSENVTENLPDNIVINTGTEPPPETNPPATRPQETTPPETKPSAPLTPDGNVNLVDDVQQAATAKDDVPDKQFITIQSKNGNYFYLVIDRTKDEENVYFLNLVDEADLLALMEDPNAAQPIVTCSCTGKCHIGAVNVNCEICRLNVVECVGQEPEPETTEATEPVEPVEEENSGSAVPVLILLVALAAGGAVYWFKFRQTGPDTSGPDDLDDYDYGQEDEEEETEIDDSELMAEQDEEE